MARIAGSRTKALVSYRYSVAGRDYSGDRIAFGGEASGPKGRAERTVAAYPVGSPVPVFYDPARPESAVLEPENRFVATIWLCVGLVMFGAVALMLFLRYRARRDAAL